MKKAPLLLYALVTSCILYSCSHLSTDKNSNIWTGFRGINCSGIAEGEQDPPVLFNPDKNVLWKVALPGGHSSPCIWGKSIFITGVDTANKLLKMFCISRTNGKIRWVIDKKVEKFEEVNSFSSPATATPATDGERVYFYFSSFGLLCYDYDGELQWEMPIPLAESMHGMGTSPIVTGDLVILNCFGHWNDPRLLAVNKYDGNIVWKYSVPNKDEYYADSYATPVIYNDQVIINTSNEVAGYSITTGEQIWKYLNDCMDAVCTPVIGNDLLYTNGLNTFGNPIMMAQFPQFGRLLAERDKNGDSKIDKKEMEDFQFLWYPEKPEVSKTLFINDYMGEWLDKNNDNYYDETEWKVLIEFMESYREKQGLKAIKLGGKGDISISNYVWGYPEQASHVSSPLYYKNHVYIIKDGGIVSCFNAEDGKLLYQESLGAAGAYFTSPIAVNDRIYIASRNGIVTVFESGDSLKILAQNDLEENITATPAVVNNKLYLRTSGYLYAFGK
jgi:outer membrane protein assembly factor BamB